MTPTFDAAAVTAFVVYVCVAARRAGLTSRRLSIAVAFGTGTFATVVYGLINGYADAPTWSGLGTLLLMAASQAAAGLGVFYTGEERPVAQFPEPPRIRREGGNAAHE